MKTCKSCQEAMTPSKKGTKSFCGPKCRAAYWYNQNRQVTMDRAAQWRKDNPEKMARFRASWRERNPQYDSEYTQSWRGDTENYRISVEAVEEALRSDLSHEELVELAHRLLDMRMGVATPRAVEDFICEILDE